VVASWPGPFSTKKRLTAALTCSCDSAPAGAGSSRMPGPAPSGCATRGCEALEGQDPTDRMGTRSPWTMPGQSTKMLMGGQIPGRCCRHRRGRTTRGRQDPFSHVHILTLIARHFATFLRDKASRRQPRQPRQHPRFRSMACQANSTHTGENPFCREQTDWHTGIQLPHSRRVYRLSLLQRRMPMWLARNEQGTLCHQEHLQRNHVSACHIGP